MGVALACARPTPSHTPPFLSSTSQVTKGDPPAKAAVTLTIADADFGKLVAGKATPQQLFLTRKLKIGGSMALALKLTPVLAAAGPRAKL